MQKKQVPPTMVKDNANPPRDQANTDEPNEPQQLSRFISVRKMGKLEIEAVRMQGCVVNPVA